MRRLLTTTAVVMGACYFGVPITAHASIIDAFCGPLAEGGCGDGPKVYLDNAKAVTTVTGNVGANNKGPGVVITSDKNMMLTVTLDAGGGFANITPGGKANFFNGIDFSIPGYEFTSLIFSVQMEAKITEPTDTFTIDGFRGLGVNRLADQISPTETAKTDADQEFSITALAGAFDDVDIFSSTGFNEIKHIKVGGLCQIIGDGCTPVIIDTPEPSSIAILGLGLLGIGAAARRPRR